MKVRINLSLDQDIFDRLDRLRAGVPLSRSAYVTQLIRSAPERYSVLQRRVESEEGKGEVDATDK
jgi:metal-responsive CopG/Arc/MetJ family transcriptional regulator